jgi:hypothetical protein
MFGITHKRKDVMFYRLFALLPEDQQVAAAEDLAEAFAALSFEQAAARAVGFGLAAQAFDLLAAAQAAERAAVLVARAEAVAAQAVAVLGL